MLRYHFEGRIPFLLQAARRRLPRWRRSQSGSEPRLLPAERVFTPRFRRLEPRIVLNATAELSALGQLLVTGTSAAETVQLGIDTSGELQLRDGAGTIIPIANHPDGIGFETNPLDPTLIDSGEILFDTGGGADVLDLQLPSGLNVTVADGGGNDVSILRFAEDRSPGTIDVQSDSIQIDSSSSLVSARDAELILVGDVTLGTAGTQTELALGGGSLDIEGRLILSGDVAITGIGSNIDFSAAILTADTSDSTLTVDLQNLSGSDLSIGGANDSAGSFLREIDVRSASSVSLLNAPTIVAGNFYIAATDTVQIDADIDTTGDSSSGDIDLQAFSSITLASDASLSVGAGMIEMDAGGGPIDLLDGRLQSDNTGDAITIQNAGDVMLGDVTAVFGAVSLGVDGSEVGDVSQAPDTALIVDRLSIVSTGSVDLSNPQNQIRLIERIDVAGDLSITDSLSNLAVIDIDSRGRNVILASPGSILIARIEAISAEVRLTANSINDASDDALADITASRVFLDAKTGIGNLRSLELMSVGELTATSASGDIVLDSLGSGPIELRRVIAGDGAIVISSVGTMTATEVTSQNAAAADDGSRDLELTVIGNENELLVGTVTAAGGAAALLTAHSINDLTVDSLADITASRVFLDAQTGIGNLRLLELMSVGELTATSASGDIVLDSLGSGPIELRRVIAGDGAIVISSVGTMTATEVTSQNAAAADDGSRDIELTVLGNESDLLVGAITAAAGADVRLQAGDDILDTDQQDGNSIVADDLALLAGNGSADSNIAINLTTSINDLEAAVTGANRGDLFIRELGSITMASSDALGDEIVETSNGQIVVTAKGNITIADTSQGDEGADWKQDPEIVARGVQGRIDLEASATIELLDEVQLHSEQVTTRYPNPETVNDPAESQLQREDRAVFLKSDAIVFGQRIEINTGVDQGVARFFAPRPIVVIDRTDPNRPRPAPPADPDVIPAFFDPFSVSTTILAQAFVNDATGTLAIDIGGEGERGLTVDIDWGAASDLDRGIAQFQQLNGLSADDSIFVGIERTGAPIDPALLPGGSGLLQVRHYYTQEMIVGSRENGRAAETSPLEIRFAVRQHDSILIEAGVVSQAPDAGPTIVAGQVVSSTDNPLTPSDSPNGLENGQASFVIPPLSIPVAFFPVRDVIPKFETPEFVVVSESTKPLTQGSFEIVEASVASSVGREEYFQIRMLSPDPEGEDLAAPERLPDDILDADKIRRLFERLPDGRYEIEYVLGDGNERSILRVDVRDGEARILDQPLDAEGLLELEPIDQQTAPQEQVAPEELNAPPGIEQSEPETDDSAMRDPFSATPDLAAAALVTTIGRRYRRRKRRFSVAGRFASRRQESDSTTTLH